MNSRIEVPPAALSIILSHIERHVPGAAAYAFGSRVNGTSKPHSDLDIMIVSSSAIPQDSLENLRIDLSESDVPIKVDVVDGAALSKTFRDSIAAHAVPLQ